MRCRTTLFATLLVALALPAAATSSAARPGFYGCRMYTVKHPAAVVRPRSIVVACGDGNFYLTRLSWTSWTMTKAGGTGTGHQNDCTPNCAAGHFHTYPAEVTLSKPRTCAGHKVFTTLSWRFATQTPNGIALSGATTFNC